MRVPFMPEDQVIALMEPLDPAALQRIRDDDARRRDHRDRRPRRQQRRHRRRDRPPRPAAQRRRRQFVVPGAVRAPPRQREQWHATLIPWRNLRAIFGVLRRRELLGLLVDWGYRSDGIPVRLFDAWTTLPAGPATLAAKTGVADPAGHHRRASRTDGSGSCSPSRSRSRRPTRPTSSARPRRSPTRSPDPSGRRRSSGTASSRSGRRRPAEGADLERRGLRDAGRAAGPRAGAAAAAAARPPTGDRPQPVEARRMTRPRPAPARRCRGWPAACRRDRSSGSRTSPATSGTGWPRPRRAGAPEPAPGLPVAGGVRPGRSTRPGRRDRPEGPRATRPLRVPSFGALLPRGRADAGRHARLRRRAAQLETPELIAEAVVPGKAVLFVGLHFGSVEMAVMFLAFRVGRPSPRWRPSTIRACRPTSSGRAAWPGSGWSGCARRAGSCWTRSGTASRSVSSATAT